eukprot:1939923-Rhodomonas_salina.1
MDDPHICKGYGLLCYVRYSHTVGMACHAMYFTCGACGYSFLRDALYHSLLYSHSVGRACYAMSGTHIARRSARVSSYAMSGTHI